MNGTTHTVRRPEETNVYLVGGGIASLAAAVHLHHDAHVPAHQIHLIEASPVPGGSMGGAGDWRKGYAVRAARKLNFTYNCLYDTLSRVSSIRDPSKTVLDEIVSFNKGHDELGECRARLVATTPAGPEIVDVKSIGLSTTDRLDILGLVLEAEENVASDEIQAHFKPEFFESKFWDMWSSMYGFQPWHSAVEFRRYLHRFLHEFPHISTLAGIEHTPMNDYECVIVPLEAHLKELGVDFQYGMWVSCTGGSQSFMLILCRNRGYFSCVSSGERYLRVCAPQHAQGERDHRGYTTFRHRSNYPWVIDSEFPSRG